MFWALICDIYYFRAALLAISAYLETFQKIADAATNARGKFSLVIEIIFFIIQLKSFALNE